MTITRLTGGDTPEQISKTRKELVKAAMEQCKAAMGCMEDHHQAHNKAYKAHKEALQKAIDTLGPMAGEEPAETDEDDVKSLLAVFQKK